MKDRFKQLVPIEDKIIVGCEMAIEIGKIWKVCEEFVPEKKKAKPPKLISKLATKKDDNHKQ